jgi:hypothetical protein
MKPVPPSDIPEKGFRHIYDRLVALINDDLMAGRKIVQIPFSLLCELMPNVPVSKRDELFQRTLKTAISAYVVFGWHRVELHWYLSTQTYTLTFYL